MAEVEFPKKQHSYHHAAVASDNARCSRVGRDILLKGGSAVDSAVATMLCVGVINLHSTGMGGGGFMLVYSSHKRSAEMIDFRETAPGKSTADLFHGDAMNGIRGKFCFVVVCFLFFCFRVAYVFLPSVAEQYEYRHRHQQQQQHN